MSIGHKAYHGFTLVELLVVIAIISVLAAMLLPTLAHSRELARLASCLNSLKQAGVTVMLYANDSGELPSNLDPANYIL